MRRGAAGEERGKVRIEDCGVNGDLQSAALIGGNRSVEWLCLVAIAEALSKATA